MKLHKRAIVTEDVVYCKYRKSVIVNSKELTFGPQNGVGLPNRLLVWANWMEKFYFFSFGSNCCFKILMSSSNDASSSLLRLFSSMVNLSRSRLSVDLMLSWAGLVCAFMPEAMSSQEFSLRYAITSFSIRLRSFSYSLA